MRSKILLVQVVLAVSWSILLLNILAEIAFAEWPSDPTVNVPICTAANDQDAPQLVSDGAGGAIVTWADRRGDTGDIYAQRVDANGAVLWTTDGVPICTAADCQWGPKLVSDGTGGTIIAWWDVLWGNGICAQRVDASGAVLWKTDGVLIIYGRNDPSSMVPSVVSDGAGGAIIAWEDYRDGNYDDGDIYAQRIDSSGTMLWTTDGVLICTSAGNQYVPELVSDGAGGAIITWSSGSWPNSDIHAQRVDASGAVLWTTNGVPICTAAGYQGGPQPVSDGAGGAIITWEDYRSGNADIYAQRVNSSGAVLWTTDGVPISTVADSYWGYQVVNDGASSAIITWENESGDIYAQRVDANGNVLWTTNGVPISGVVSVVPDVFSVVSDGADGAIITWQDIRSGLDIYAQRVDSSGAVLWTTDGVPICTEADDKYNPKLVSDGAGGAIITWMDWRSGDADIYAQNVNADGTLGGGPDITPPSAITDLATSNPTPDSITLTWTAPGDDGDAGTARQYDIRYSTSPIDEGNWDDATQVVGEMPPKLAGSAESFVVTGLSPGTTYYFAIKTSDEVPNWSGLSNVASGTTGSIANIDLSISDSDISVSPSESPPGMMNITAQIHNVGSVDVQNIVVRFLDENLSAGTTSTIDEQTIPQLAALESTELTTLWQPIVEEHKLHVIIDPDDQIKEDREDNNIATKTFHLNKPFIKSVRAMYDGNSDPDVIGTFISNVQAINTFTAEVIDPDGDDDMAFVTFTLGENTQTDDNPDGGWTASFDMEQLSGDEILSVKAYDKSGVASLEKLLTVHVIPIPSWLIDAVGLAGIDMNFENGWYSLTAEIPSEPFEYSHVIDEAVVLLGGLDSMFEAGFTFELRYNVDGRSKLIADGMLNAKVLGYPAHGSISVDADFNPDLSFGGATGELSLGIGFPLPEVSHPIPIVIYGVPIGNINLKVGGSVNASLDGSATIDAQLALTQAEITPGVGIRVDLAAELEDILRFGKIAFIAHPTAEINFTITYTKADGTSGSVSGMFVIPYEVVGSYFWGLGEKRYENTLGPWDFSTGEQLPQAMFVRAETPNLPDMLVSPHIATDGAGNAMLVWVQDEDPVSESVDPEIYYSFWNGTDWSDVAPIRDTELFENDPVVTFDASGNALVLWMCNTADRSLGDTGTLNEILSYQEIFFSKWDGATWSDPAFITNDNVPDGLAAIAADHFGNAMAVWVRDLDGDVLTRADSELWFATWDGNSWSIPAALTSDAATDYSVDVAFDQNGNAIAVWIRDEDADINTRSDTEIYYAEWNGANWSIPAPVTANDEKERRPSIAFAPDGTAILTWASDLVIGFENLERIYTAIKPPGGIWTSPDIVTESKEMAESPTVNVDSRGIAMVVWRGYNGYDGDLFYAMSDVHLGNWTTPRTLTDDDASSWLATTAIDSNNNALTIWASQSFGEPEAQSDGVALAPMNPQLRFDAKGIKPNLSLSDVLNSSVRPIKPDLTVGTDDITFSNPKPAVGESVTISATIHNRGDVESESTVVKFFDGDPSADGVQIGDDRTLNALAADASQDVSVNWTATAGEHQILVQIDPDDLVDEFTEDNNIASNSILIVPDVSITGEDIAFSDENPVLGDTVTISATVHNTGGADATDVAVRFYDGNPDDGGMQIGNDQIIVTIPIGGTGAASVDWTSTAGVHEIFVVLDPDETIVEWDEENNRASALIRVLPDLSISVADISLTVPEPDVPNGVEISVTVHNLGGVDAENVGVAIYLGDPLADVPLIDSKTIPAITAGSSETTSLSWMAPAGTSDVYVKVDESKEIDERDEANNTAFNSITIILKPDLSLTAEDISLDAEFPLAGKPAIITANIHNENSSVVGVLVSFYDGDPNIDGTLIGSDLIPTIDAPATGVATVEWDTTDKVEHPDGDGAGEHTLYVVVDEQEKIDELDETNNVAQKLVEVVICGDLSGNGESTAYDATLILQSVVGLEDLTPAQIAAADTSGNGSVSALDAALILQYSVGLISEYPALEPIQVTPMFLANPKDAEISIGSLSAKPGQVVSVPIALRGNGILAVGMVLNYNDELLEFQGLNRKLAKTEFSHSDGRLQIAVAGDADLPKGELIFVNFLLKNSVSLISEIPLTFAKAEVNEGNFAIRLKSGSISILPDKYSLLQNYPNPFNPDTWIPYQLPESADVLIKIYNVRGELVRTLALGVQPAGNYVQTKKAAYWDGRNDAGERVASAVYFYTIQAVDFCSTRKMVLLK